MLPTKCQRMRSIFVITTSSMLIHFACTGVNSKVSTTETPAPSPACHNSSLWGVNGELATPQGSLMNFAWAGYHAGQDPIPDISGPIYDVRNFGAIADDNIDDSDAFQAAIQAANPGVVSIPQGRFVIAKRLNIDHGHIVIRGQGIEQTRLDFPKSLGELYGLTIKPQSNWSFSGGFISASGRDQGPELAKVTAVAKRGDQVLQVSDAASIVPGQWIRLVMRDNQGSLLKAFHAGQYPGATEDLNREIFHFPSQVLSVQDKTITLARPLPIDVDPLWTPSLRSIAPTIAELGLEHFSMHFPATVYPGHFKEQGYNAINLAGVQQSWVRDIKIVNADYGINMSASFFSTVTDVILDTDGDRGALVGHHGINSAGGSDLLVQNFDVRQKFIHDLTVDGYALLTVWSHGKGLDIDMDHHGRAPYGTLWTDIDLGLGTRAFASGGKAERMPYSGAFTTFWNLRARQPLKAPNNNFGPSVNFVETLNSQTAIPSDWTLETWSDGSVCQPDLYQAQKVKRTGPKDKASPHNH